MNPESPYPSDIVPNERTQYIPNDDPRWSPLGPFPRAIDWAGDGSLYIVDAPGHMPGHVNALVRTSPDGGWIFLASDSAHDRRLLHGQSSIACHPSFGCVHIDVTATEAHIARIRQLMEIERVREGEEGWKSLRRR